MEAVTETPVAEATAEEPQEAQALTLPEKDFLAWKSRVEKAEKEKKDYKPTWDENVEAMSGFGLKEEVESDTVVVNKDWSRVKAKQADLFFQVPEIRATTNIEALKTVAPLYSAVINEYLTRVKSHVVMDEILPDVLNAAGFGVSKIGYEAVTEETEVPETDISHLPPEMQMAMLQAKAVKMVKATKVIHEQYYWERISPGDFIWPSGFKSSDWDKAPWLGFAFLLPFEVAKQKYKLPDDFQGKTSGRDENKLGEPDNQVPEGDNVRGWEIWLKASLFDPSVKHPLLLRRLVIIEGMKEPAVYEDAKCQEYDEMTGKIKGIKKFPIRVLTLTYISDKAIPPSDSTISRPQVRELWKSRSQRIRQRDSSLPMRWFDINLVDDDTEAKLREGKIQEMIPMNGPGERAIGEIARANYPRESFELEREIKSDLDEQWSMGPNQTGSPTPGETTAEEVKAMSAGRGVRLDYERAKVLRYIVEAAEILGDLIQLYATDEDYVEVVGPDGVPRIQQWSAADIQGEYVFKAKPDSAQRVDVVQERNDAIRMYNLMRQDPLANPRKMVERVLSLHGCDPEIYAAKDDPKKGPEPPNVSYRFAGADLDPALPQFPIVVTILGQSGIQLGPDVLAAAQAIRNGLSVIAPGAPKIHGSPQQAVGHGGQAEKTEPLSKHVNDNQGRI